MKEEIILIMGDVILFLVLLFCLLPYIKDPFNLRVDLLRKFIDNNDGIFNILFLGIFALEQIVLLYLIFKFDEDVRLLTLIIGIFALVVVTTASTQKIIFDIKRKYDEKKYFNAKRTITVLPRLVTKYKNLSEEHSKLKKELKAE